MPEYSKVETRIIPTGQPELDKKMGGGIPTGSLTLVEGQSAAGKSVFAQQVTWGSLSSRCRVSYFTTENTVKSLVRQMESLNLDVLDYLLLDRLRIYPVQVTRARGKFDHLLQHLIYAIGREKESDIVVVDSLTSFISHGPVDDIIAFFEECKNYCNRGMTIIATVHSYVFDDSTIIRIRAMCDAHLRVRIDEMGDRLTKSLEASKVRGADKGTGNIISFDVEPGIGMKIIPKSSARA